MTIKGLIEKLQQMPEFLEVMTRVSPFEPQFKEIDEPRIVRLNEQNREEGGITQQFFFLSIE